MRNLIPMLCLILTACPAEDAVTTAPQPSVSDVPTPTLQAVQVVQDIPTVAATVDTGVATAAPNTTVGADVGQFESPPGLPPVPHGVLPCVAVWRVGPPDNATDFCVFQVATGGVPGTCVFTKTLTGDVTLSCWSTFQ